MDVYFPRGNIQWQDFIESIQADVWKYATLCEFSLPATWN
jgi:hypothetical protein